MEPGFTPGAQTCLIFRVLGLDPAWWNSGAAKPFAISGDVVVGASDPMDDDVLRELMGASTSLIGVTDNDIERTTRDYADGEDCADCLLGPGRSVDRGLTRRRPPFDPFSLPGPTPPVPQRNNGSVRGARQRSALSAPPGAAVQTPPWRSGRATRRAPPRWRARLTARRTTSTSRCWLAASAEPLTHRPRPAPGSPTAARGGGEGGPGPAGGGAQHRLGGS